MVHRWKQRGWGAHPTVKGSVFGQSKCTKTSGLFRKNPAPKSSNSRKTCPKIIQLCVAVGSEVLRCQGEHATMFAACISPSWWNLSKSLACLSRCLFPQIAETNNASILPVNHGPHPHWTSRATNDTSSAMRGRRGFPMQNPGGADNLDRSIKLLAMQFLLMQT